MASDNALASYVDLVTAEVKRKTGLDPAETQMNIILIAIKKPKRATEFANGETYNTLIFMMSGSIHYSGWTNYCCNWRA